MIGSPFGRSGSSAAGQALGDLLEPPAVAVRIAERGERAVAGPLRIWTVAGFLTRGAMEHLADVSAALDELRSSFLDVGDDQIHVLSRSGSRRGKPGADVDRAGRAGGSELDHAKAVVGGEVDVEAPPQTLVERLCAIYVGDRNHHHLEPHIAGTRRLRGFRRALTGYIGTAHLDPLGSLFRAAVRELLLKRVRHRLRIRQRDPSSLAFE